VRQNGILRLCANPSALPYSNLTDRGGLPGFEVELAEVLAHEMGLQLGVIWVRNAGDAKNSDCDVLMGVVASAASYDREGLTGPLTTHLPLRFSRPYADSGVVLVISARSLVRRLEDLRGQKIGVMVGTAEHEWLAKHGFRVSVFASQEDIIAAIEAGATGYVLKDSDGEEILNAVIQAATGRGVISPGVTPTVIEELTEALGSHHSKLPLIVLIGGLCGGIGGYALQFWAATMAYPINVGGKPLHSWPAFIPITFECTILVAALSAVFGMLALNGLPMPYHPVFNVPRFALASKDRFFLIIFASDAKYDAAGTRQFLEGFHPRSLSEVPS
jgi:hypothetical protein